ncbi:MAG: hypothetical protein VB070_05180 [Clostridiaceae bacterium]|nr:hypothetical protein [Clostridiaceae bacterium]
MLMIHRRNSQVRLLLAAAALVLALMLLIPDFLITNANQGLVQAGSPSASAARPANAVLIIHEDTSSSSAYRLMQQILSSAGYTSQTLAWQEENGTPEFSAALSGLAAAAGCRSEQVWVLAIGGAAAPSFKQTCQTAAAGLILVTPRDLGSLTAAELDLWPADRPIDILGTHLNTAAADWPEPFFERLTGEDATLFAGYQPAGPLSGVTRLSADGLAALTVYPVLYSGLAALSPRVITDITLELADWQQVGSELNAGQANPVLLARTANGQASVWLVRGLLSLLLLILSPLLANGFIAAPHLPAPAEYRPWLSDLLLWLLAFLAAGGLGVAAAWLIHWSHGWPVLAAALLPGCRGWLALAGRRIMWESADSGVNSYHRRPFRLAGFLVPLAWIALACLIAAHFLGTVLSPILPWYIWLLFMIFNGSAGLAAPVGPAGHEPASASGRLDWSIRYLPCILLPILFFVLQGWSGACAGILTGLIFCWTVNAGKAAASLSRMPVWSGLIQSVLYVLLIEGPLILLFS